MRNKKFLSLITAIITLAVSVSPAFAAADEVEAVAGTIEACRENEIYVNEDFSGDKLPAGDTANGLATWKFSGAAGLSDGRFMLASDAYGKVVLKTPIEKVGSKYVLSYDLCNTTEKDGIMYGFNINIGDIRHGKPVMLWANKEKKEYSIRIGPAYTTVASDIPNGKFVNIKLIITVVETGLECDATVSMDGTVIGDVKNINFAEFQKDKSGNVVKQVDTLLWGYGGDYAIDNIKFYPYMPARVAEPTITEVPVSGAPEMAEGTTLLIDENFDSFPENILDSTYTGADTSIWRLEGNKVNGETKILSSGRKALKLSKEAGLLAGVAPSEKLAYSDAEGSGNKYVLRFGMRPKVIDDSCIVGIINSEGKKIDIINTSSDGVMTVGEEEFTLLDKWYSVAVSYEFRTGNTAVNVALTDSNETKSFKKLIIPESNSIDEFIWQTGNDGIMYIDNVSLYRALYIAPKKPEARNMTVTGTCYNGRELTGYYEYYDANQEDRGEDEYYWVRSDNAEGGPYEKIKGTDQSLTYTLSKDDIGKHVFFAVIPKKAEGCDEATGDITYKAADAVIEEEPAVLDLEWLIEKNLGADDLSEVTGDLILSLKGENGSTITWHSDDEDTIGTDGTVKRQTSLRNVTLTATITSPDKVVTKEHKFEVSVKAKKTSSGGSSGGGASNVIKGSSSVISMPVEMLAEDTNKPMERPKHKYNDVPDGHWAMDYIQELYHREIAMGDENNNFAPSRSIKREEFTKMIVSAFNLIDDTAFVEFSDVDTSAWYYPYVASAYKSLLVSGLGNDKFGIGANITRQDMAVIAYRILNAEGAKIENDAAYEEFTDFNEVSDYAKTAVSAMKKAGIMNGSGNNEFSPKAYATRAEVARIIVALLEKTEK